MNDTTNEHCAACRGPLGRSRLRRAGLLAVAAAGVALLAAACSGGTTTTTVVTTPPTTSAPTAAASTTAAPATAATTYQLAVAYAQCMRTHGEPNWPDPASDGNFGGYIDTSTAQYVSANRTCGHLLPNGGVLTQAQTHQALTALSRYAACMRSHGIPKYPDPDPRYVQAGLTGPGYISVQALNITMQQFNSASQACLKLQPGYGRTS